MHVLMRGLLFCLWVSVSSQVIMVVVWGFGRFRNFSQKPPHTLCGFPPAGELPPVLLEALVNSGTSGGARAGLLAMVPKWVLW